MNRTVLYSICGVLITFIIVALGISFLTTPPQAEAPSVPTPLQPAPVTPVVDPRPRTVGYSVAEQPIELYTYGTGETDLLFVGGVHGGYEWNSVLLAYEFIDSLEAGRITIPETLTVHIIPNLNPDGLTKITGKNGRFSASDIPAGIATAPGRFNQNGVDLNRNFDCKWQPKSTWRGNEVSAGNAPFSEPEAQALRDIVTEIAPQGVVFWHSKANAVYASECHEGILPLTRVLMNSYAKAAGYQTVDVFDAYPVTGDAEGWLASIGIPAITVELATHESIEWDKNLAGFTAVLNTYHTLK
jgi:predicted deacylase